MQNLERRFESISVKAVVITILTVLSDRKGHRCRSLERPVVTPGQPGPVAHSDAAANPIRLRLGYY
jgi:hypothetical protein